MEKIKILGIGISGLVGSRITELLGNSYNFNDLSLETNVDITNREAIINTIESSDAQIVLLLAAKTNVDGCEEDKVKDLEVLRLDAVRQKDFWQKEKTAWGVNVYGTQNVVDACKKGNKKIIYFSTDFVFSGNGAPQEGYCEEDNPGPINWYGQTKYEAEKIIQNSNPQNLIMRLAYPYRSNFVRYDFVRGLIEQLKKGNKLNMVEDHIITPTFIDDIATALDLLIKNNSNGIFHIVGSQFVSPYQAALLIAKTFNLNQDLIAKTTREVYFQGKAKRPFDLSIKNGKIQKLGLRMRDLKEGLLELKLQIENQ